MVLIGSKLLPKNKPFKVAFPLNLFRFPSQVPSSSSTPSIRTPVNFLMFSKSTGRALTAKKNSGSLRLATFPEISTSESSVLILSPSMARVSFISQTKASMFCRVKSFCGYSRPPLRMFSLIPSASLLMDSSRLNLSTADCPPGERYSRLPSSILSFPILKSNNPVLDMILLSG